MARILIIAPDSELRKSMEFALSVEGHEITTRASIGAHERPGYDCTIVDQHGIGTNVSAAVSFCTIFEPVVLLTSQLPHPLSPIVHATLLKPLLGAALVAAVNASIGAASPK